MRASSARRARWMLLSDIHFKHKGLHRVEKTAQWIAAEAERNKVDRAVVCGDLLTSRTMQRTDVLSACYRFIDLLSEAVPRVHILLGNHDLAYRRKYQITALDALSIRHLAPHVVLHKDTAQYQWDGRRVLTLPFREDQHELTRAVAAIPPDEASETIAFGHLAINKAILQRRVVSAGGETSHEETSIKHAGRTGPHEFASLARTFTGHFHTHQTITQKRHGSNDTNLKGSITYIGAPLQLSWADLHDDQRGVLLLDPDSLEHKLIVNPHAVGYMPADIEHVLNGQIDKGTVNDKYIMLTGNLNRLSYITARDKLISLGACGVQDMAPMRFDLLADRRSISDPGASVPDSDAAVQPHKAPTDGMGTTSAGDRGPTLEASTESSMPQLDIEAELTCYVDSLDLDSSLTQRRDELIRTGQQILQVSRDIVETGSDLELNYDDFVEKAGQVIGARTTTRFIGPSGQVFVAEPCTLTVTNFLSVQNTIVVDFRRDIVRGITLLVGDNGSGKSALLEAMVWCQFGKCIRDGLPVKDVVNDNVGKNCSVKLEFANGYTIERYRKHRTYKDRVIVKLRGEPQPQLECPEWHMTQKAINELLGIDYKTYVATVVLGQESSASFLNLTQAQRRDLIEKSLGLSILDQCGRLSGSLLKDIDTVMSTVKTELDGLMRTKEQNETRLRGHEQTYARLLTEAEKAASALNATMRDHADAEAKAREGRVNFQNEMLALQEQIHAEKNVLHQLECSHAKIKDKEHVKSKLWLGWRFTSVGTAIVRTLLMALRSLFRSLLGACGFPLESSQNQECDKEAAIGRILGDIQASQLRLQKLEHEERTKPVHAMAVSERLAQTTRGQCKIAELQQQATTKQHGADIYKHLAEKEQSSLQLLRVECDTAASKLQELLGKRELFVFWSSALAKRSFPASSKSLPGFSNNIAVTFREHIRGKSLTDLNMILEEVLMVLYGDTRHAYMATGMLRSLFETEPEDGVASSLPSQSVKPVLSTNLAVHPSFAYGKRSGGERKRIDIALFFALLQLERCRSAHRAHYVLVDEVFDKLDGAGQAAVMKWCSVMSRTAAPWVVVITHSRFLVEQDSREGVSKALVVEAKMGRAGTELYADNCRIGIN